MKQAETGLKSELYSSLKTWLDLRKRTRLELGVDTQNSRVQYLFMSAREAQASESKDSDTPHGGCARGWNGLTMLSENLIISVPNHSCYRVAT